MVTSPSGRSTIANITELEEGLYAVNFVPQELGIHTVTVRYREMDIPGSPFQFTVGPLQDSGSHRVHAGQPLVIVKPKGRQWNGLGRSQTRVVTVIVGLAAVQGAAISRLQIQDMF